MRDDSRAIPLAYLITFTCFGTRLHGDAAGSVDRSHNLPGTPHLTPNPKRLAAASQRMTQAPYELDAPCREVALQTIVEVCEHRHWSLLAAHIRSNHLHIVVHAPTSPELVMNDLKAYISRRLTERGVDSPNQKRWTRHGSTRYLWKHEQVEAAIHYVVEEQGQPMAVFENRARTLKSQWWTTPIRAATVKERYRATPTRGFLRLLTRAARVPKRRILDDHPSRDR